MTIPQSKKTKPGSLMGAILSPCLVFLFICILSASVNAATLTCTVKASCDANETDVLHMSNTSNAHAQLPNQTTYAYKICCKDTDNATTIGTGSGTSFLKLSDVTNAHVEMANLSNYNYSANMSSSNFDYVVACEYDESSCGRGTCVASISNATNAQIGDCDAYSTKVCCSIGPNSESCREITSSGSYSQSYDFTGAPYDVSNLPGKACILISSSDVVWDCNGFSITNNVSGTTYGITLNGSLTNVTVRNCPGISNYSYGIYVYESNDSLVTNNTVHNNAFHGIYLEGSNNNTISYNTAHHNSQSGILLYDYSDDNTVIGNSAYSNLFSGIGTYRSSDNNATGNTANDNVKYGFVLTQDSNTNDFSSNYAYNNTLSGFGIEVSSIRNSLTGNNATDNTVHGYYIDSSALNNFLTDNNAYSNTQYGFAVYANNSILTGNNATANAAGYQINSASKVNLTGNLADSCTSTYGFYMAECKNITLINNTASNNNAHGFVLLSNSDDARLYNNTAHGNGQYGIWVYNSRNALLSGDHYYDNDLDFVALNNLGSSYNITLSETVFDNSAGGFSNYTSISISDVLENNNEYSIDWTTNSSALPAGTRSFEGKFVDITNYSASITIDSITWHWTDAEAVGYDESKLQIWKDDSGSWSDVSAILHPASNTLSIEDLQLATDYAILESNVTTTCPAIATSGIYTQTSDLAGAPHTATPLLGKACIYITSSDVVYDCNGYNLTNNVAGTTYGIMLNGSLTNVTIRNCPGISNYSYGIYSYHSNNSLITNNTANNNVLHGIFLDGSGNNTLSSNTAHHNSQSGILIYQYSDDNTVIDNEAYLNLFTGIGIYRGSDNNLSGNTAYNNTKYGFALSQDCSTNNLTGNSAYNNTLSGFDIDTSSLRNTLTGNNATDNLVHGYYIDSSSENNFLVDNDAYSNTQYGFATQADYSVFAGNNATANGAGFLLSGAASSNLTDNLADSSTLHGFDISASSNSKLTSNTASDNGGHGFLIQSLSNDIETYGNTAHGNAQYGIWVYNSDDAVLTGDHLYDNGYDFRVLDNTGSSMGIRTYGMIFDNPTGAYSSFTNLSIADTVENGNEYSFNWSANSSAPPYTSFEDKYLTITDHSTHVSIDSIVWHWSDAELSGYFEPSFELWRYNGTWSNASAVLNTGTNTLTISGLAPASIYGILQSSDLSGISDCITINSSGSYQLTNDLNCAPGTPGGQASIYITASDVVLNCADFGMTNGESGTTYGILISNNATNVTIENCTIYGYTYAVKLDDVDDIELNNNNYHHNDFGVHVDPSYNNTIINSNFYSNSLYGLYLEDSHNNTVQDNTAYNNTIAGFYLNISTNNDLEGNDAYENGHGFVLDDSADNNLTSNTAYSNTNNGIFLNGASGTSMSSNIVYGNGHDFYVDGTGGYSYDMGLTSFRSPSEAYPTVVSITDTVGAAEEYFVDWDAIPAVPDGLYPAANKYVNITTVSGTVSLDSIVWHWTDPEMAPYDESTLDIWMYDGTNWTQQDAALSTSANTLTLTNLGPASGYGILGNNSVTNLSSYGNITLWGADVTNVTFEGRYNGSAADNWETEGGNVSGQELNITMLTDRWAAMFGNVTGGIVLQENGAGIAYQWLWNASNGGLVCVSTNNSLTTFAASGAKGVDIDTAWSFSSTITDSGTNTFNNSGCDLTFVSETVSNASYVDTGSAGGFRTCAIKTVVVPQKSNMIFCSAINATGTLYNGGTGNFEIMAPAEAGPNAYETYYFYASLN